MKLNCRGSIRARCAAWNMIARTAFTQLNYSAWTLLGIIAGLVMYGWILGHSAVIHPDPAERTWARDELAWWVPRARRALEAWSPA